MKRRKRAVWKTYLFLIILFICVGAIGAVSGKTNAKETYEVKKIEKKVEKKDVMVNKNQVELKVEYISQYPELPTGCEATALTMALSYRGFPIAKEDIARNYMDKTDYPGDFIHYYVGDPFTETGLGIYAPGLSRTANNYLKTQNTQYKAFDISGTSFDKLFDYIRQGNPVIIWTTYHLERDPKESSAYTLDDGKTYTWKSNEHCMVLIGFDLEADTVTIANPAIGIVRYPQKLIEKRYNQFERMAVVIK